MAMAEGSHGASPFKDGKGALIGGKFEDAETAVHNTRGCWHCSGNISCAKRFPSCCYGNGSVGAGMVEGVAVRLIRRIRVSLQKRMLNAAKCSKARAEVNQTEKRAIDVAFPAQLFTPLVGLRPRQSAFAVVYGEAAPD